MRANCRSTSTGIVRIDGTRACANVVFRRFIDLRHKVSPSRWCQSLCERFLSYSLITLFMKTVLETLRNRIGSETSLVNREIVSTVARTPPSNEGNWYCNSTVLYFVSVEKPSTFHRNDGYYPKRLSFFRIVLYILYYDFTPVIVAYDQLWIDYIFRMWGSNTEPWPLSGYVLPLHRMPKLNALIH